jgi:hypothetical protein
MSATLIFDLKRSLFTKKGFEIEIRMDVYKIDHPEGRNFPDGYRFSWIAFDRSDPLQRVLFDCHPPKGPHLHVDQDKEGISFRWENLEKSMQLFWEKVWWRFGDREEGNEE